MGKETENRKTMLWPLLLVLLDHNRMVWKIPTYTWQCTSSQTRPPASQELGLRGQTEQAEMEAQLGLAGVLGSHNCHTGN